MYIDSLGAPDREGCKIERERAQEKGGGKFPIFILFIERFGSQRSATGRGNARERSCPATGEIEVCLKAQSSEGATGQPQGTRNGEQGVRGSGTEKEREKEQRVKGKNSERMVVSVGVFISCD